MNLKRTVIFIAVVLIIGLSAYALSFGANIGDYEVVPVRDAIKYGLDPGAGVCGAGSTAGRREAVTGDMLDRAVATIRNRVDTLGVSEPVIVKQGENRIRVELPDVADSEKAIEMIGKPRSLNSWTPTEKRY